MKFTITAAAMAIAVAGASAAVAQEKPNAGTGFTLSVRAGSTSVSDADLVFTDDGGTFGGTGATDTVATRVKARSAFAFGGSIGYDFGTVRTDVEVDYSRNRIRALQIRSVNGTPVTTISAADAADFCDYAELDRCSVSGTTVSFEGGRVRQLSAIANLWLDIPVGSVVTPYVGGGVGIGGFEVEGEGKARFAWQLGAGVAVNVSPRVAITGDARYRQIGGATFRDAGFPDYALRVGDLKSKTFTAGLRFTF